MRWTYFTPKITRIPRDDRGLKTLSDYHYCFVIYRDNEQEEPGDTTIHTFTKEPWANCETRWFYFHGTIGDVGSPSTSAYFKYHRLALPPVEPILKFDWTGTIEFADTVFSDDWYGENWYAQQDLSIAAIELPLSQYYYPQSTQATLYLYHNPVCDGQRGDLLTQVNIDLPVLPTYPNYQWIKFYFPPIDIINGDYYGHLVQGTHPHPDGNSFRLMKGEKGAWDYWSFRWTRWNIHSPPITLQCTDQHHPYRLWRIPHSS